MVARQPTTRLQVSGHRFVLRRMEHALVRRDVRMVDEPMRSHSRSLLVGCLLAAIALAGCVVVAVFRPALGDAPVVMAKDSGALFLRIGDTLHPVLNLASARLIVGTAADPAIVRDSELANSKRGALVGIPGAPAMVAEPMQAHEAHWTICDDPRLTTVIVGAPDARSGARPLQSTATLFVRSRSGPEHITYLLYDGRRARVPRGDRAVERALQLDGAEPIAVSSSLLNAIPEVAPITAPHIPGAGRPGPAALGGLPVGTVTRVARAEGDEHYVVLQGGVQRIGPVAADVIRFGNAGGGNDIVAVPPAVISTAPALDLLPVADFPQRILSLQRHRVVCARWVPSAEGDAGARILVGAALPLSADEAPVSLAQADDTGPALDAVFVPPARLLYARANGLHVIADTGVRFAVEDAATGETLGLPPDAIEAPWPVLRLLPEGPRLSKDDALVAHDVLLPAGGGVAVPAQPGPPAPR